MSPRRSSRARSSANPPPTSQTASSTSSVTLKTVQTVQRSVSVEDPARPENESTNELTMPRRSRRNGVEESRDTSQAAKPIDGREDGHEPGDDDAEEVTRCICGRAEYPGPTYNLMYGRGETAIAEPMTKDTGDFFVQCDKCLVWQHGGCVGFQDEPELPDEYFCELCRPKLHKLYKEQNGRRSHYFTSRQLGSVTKESPTEHRPATKKEGDASRSSSLSSGEPRKKDGKKATMSESTKRRATMNSRGAYDEDEMLRRAIEESNRETGTLGKRTREVGDDSKQALKRQRTGSMSSDSKRSVSPTATDDGPGRKSKQSLRGAAAKSNKEREAREKVKEQQLAARAEAASKRHARSERRRGDDSPPPSPSVSPSKAHSKDKSDPSIIKTTSAKTKTGRNGRNGVGSSGRRLGRNQYTRDRDLATNGGVLDSDTPMRDLHHHDSLTNGNSPGHHNPHGGGINGESGRSSKAKTHPARTSLNEMKRRVAAILEFVGQMQTQTSRQQLKEQQRAGAGHQQHQNGPSKLSTAENGNGNANGDSGSGSGSSEKCGGSTPTASATASAVLSGATGIAGLVKAVQDATEDVVIPPPDGEGANHGPSSAGEREKPKFRDDAEFRDMGSTQMMEALTRELIAWQRVYGVYSR